MTGGLDFSSGMIGASDAAADLSSESDDGSSNDGDTNNDGSVMMNMSGGGGGSPPKRKADHDFFAQKTGSTPKRPKMDAMALNADHQSAKAFNFRP